MADHADNEPDLRIRRYRPDDADRVWTVHEAALRASDLPSVENAPADADIRNVERAYLDGDGTFLVGEVGGRVVATGGIQSVGERIAEVRRMRVHPAYQGRGFGRRLLVALERWAAENGYDTLRLETHEALTVAQGLYESHGYRRTGTETVDGHRLFEYRKTL